MEYEKDSQARRSSGSMIAAVTGIHREGVLLSLSPGRKRIRFRRRNHIPDTLDKLKELRDSAVCGRSGKRVQLISLLLKFTADSPRGRLTIDSSGSEVAMILPRLIT